MPDSKPRAIVLMLISSASFALMQFFAKYAGALPVAQKVFFRNLLGVLVLGTVLALRGGSFLGARENRSRLLLRSALGTLGVATNLYALTRMHLADSTMLNRFSPFVVMVLAALVLKEPIRRHHVGAIMAAFAGVLLVIKPSFSLDTVPALVGFSSALFAGSAYVVVRSLKGREDPLTIVFFFSLFSCLAAAPVTLVQYATPTTVQWLSLLGFGVFALGGQFFITSAYRYAPAGEVSVYGYATVIFSALLGAVFLGERPDWLSVTGIILVIGSALYLYRADRVQTAQGRALRQKEKA